METSLSRRSPYFVNPFIDAMFVCGGLAWIAGLILYFYWPTKMSGGQAIAYGIFLQIIVHVFNDAHVGATWVRLYSSKETRQRFRSQSLWLALALAVIAATSLFVPAVSSTVMKIYMVGVIQHYIAQAYGLAMIYCGRNNFFMSPTTKRLLKTTFLTLTLWICAIQLSPQQVTFYFIETPYLNIFPVWSLIIFRGLFFISLILFSAGLLREAVEAKRMPPWTFLFMLVSVFVFMVVGVKVPMLWLVGPSLFHASQYLVVSGEFVMREKGIQARRELFKNSFAYTVSVVILGYFGYQLLPDVLLTSGFQTSMAAVFAPMSIHHFLADRAMWRLRDPITRAVAVGSPA